MNMIMPYSTEDKTVAELSQRLALACGVDMPIAQMISEAAAIHDIGKSKIPRNIINKPSGLSPSERKIIKNHTIWGANMLLGVSGIVGAMSRDIALYHHEKYDGTGYWGKRSSELPFYVHIVTLCDVYVALISPRPYKDGWTKDKALEYIRTNAGKDFNPILAQMFINLVRGERP